MGFIIFISLWCVKWWVKLKSVEAGSEGGKERERIKGSTHSRRTGTIHTWFIQSKAAQSWLPLMAVLGPYDEA